MERVVPQNERKSMTRNEAEEMTETDTELEKTEGEPEPQKAEERQEKEDRGRFLYNEVVKLAVKCKHGSEVERYINKYVEIKRTIKTRYLGRYRIYVMNESDYNMLKDNFGIDKMSLEVVMLDKETMTKKENETDFTKKFREAVCYVGSSSFLFIFSIHIRFFRFPLFFCLYICCLVCPCIVQSVFSPFVGNKEIAGDNFVAVCGCFDSLKVV